MRASMVVICAVLVAGCATRPRSDSSMLDGSSVERAFVAHTSEEEVAVLKERFPGARPAGGEKHGAEDIVTFSHRTEARGSRMYSVHTLVLPDGSVRDVYFDVTDRSRAGR